MKYALIFLTLLITPLSSFAAESYIGGSVTNITSIKEGLLIRVNGDEKPSGCTQSSAWMLIPQEDTTMVSVALASFMAGKKSATVYVNTSLNGSYCTIWQYDPH